MDVVFLARIQFAANITFHILFPVDFDRAGLGAAVFQVEAPARDRPAAEARLAARLSPLDQRYSP